LSGWGQGLETHRADSAGPPLAEDLRQHLDPREQLVVQNHLELEIQVPSRQLLHERQRQRRTSQALLELVDQLEGKGHAEAPIRHAIDTFQEPIPLSVNTIRMDTNGNVLKRQALQQIGQLRILKGLTASKQQVGTGVATADRN